MSFLDPGNYLHSEACLVLISSPPFSLTSSLVSVSSPTTLPHRQNLSSSSLQALLGFPSLTFNICDHHHHHLIIILTCSSPGSLSQSSSSSAGNHLRLSLLFSSDTSSAVATPFCASTQASSKKVARRQGNIIGATDKIVKQVRNYLEK